MSAIDDAVTFMIAKISLAADFAARKHASQRRKGAAQEPYVNHLSEVASLIANTMREPDWSLVSAAWLHDTLEDTDTTYQELALDFGDRVAGIVLEVTDDKSLPKPERKRLQVERTPLKSVEARLIKLADKTSNLRSLVSSPPPQWSRDRVKAYIDWAEQVTEACLGLNAKLDLHFHAAVSAARTSVDNPPAAHFRGA